MLAFMHCSECRHTFKPSYSGIYTTHSCAEHKARQYPHIPECYGEHSKGERANFALQMHETVERNSRR